MTAPAWAVGPPSEAYRNIPGELTSPPVTSWQEIQNTGKYLIDVFVGKVAIAFGGIDIFGWKPLEFLAEWGQQRVDDALAAYAAAQNAQSSANYANIQLSLLTTGTLASDSGGVSVSEQCNGASANNFGGSWDRVSDGAGGGHYGPDGAGHGVWKKFGGLVRRHVDRHTTALSTDYQVVLCVMAAPPQTPLLGSNAYNYLCARMDSAGTTFVWARVTNNEAAVGKCVSGTWTTWDTETITANHGDQWMFLVGTSTDDRQVIVKQNGTTRLDWTDTVHSYGASYLYAGMAAQSGDRLVFLDQTVPGEVDLWTAADRLPTSV